MEYKDALGTEIKVGDTIVYYQETYGMQLGRVLELTKHDGYMRPAPAIKVQGARKAPWGPDQGFKKMKRLSTLTKFDSIVVINNNLTAIVSLM